MRYVIHVLIGKTTELWLFMVFTRLQDTLFYHICRQPFPSILSSPTFSLSIVATHFKLNRSYMNLNFTVIVIWLIHCPVWVPYLYHSCLKCVDNGYMSVLQWKSLIVCIWKEYVTIYNPSLSFAWCYCNTIIVVLP